MNPTPLSSTSLNSPPRFSKIIDVSQPGDDIGIWGMVLSGMLGGAPGFWLSVTLLGNGEATGWRAILSTIGMLGLLIVSLVGMVIGFILYFVLEERWRRWRGITLFNQSTQTILDEHGLHIEGLGSATWHQVLDYDFIPDSESALIIHTEPFGRLLLQADITSLVTVLEYHLKSTRDQAIANSHQQPTQHVFQFKAQVFHWPTFRVWIAAGYLAATAITVCLLYFASDAGFFKLLVGLLFLVPCSAWLVWAIPFWRITHGGRHIQAFELAGHSLRNTSGDWVVDLRNTSVEYQQTSGVGYGLRFITINPTNNKRFDLLIDDVTCPALIKQLRAIDVLEFDRHILRQLD
ncbi:hypothetical protein [Chitinivorax sp. B]|uniref:hypothetical protein n=1 Tax=Chitinivorax sp. B TaxID=2502235 RepID=UPI0010F74DB8|nr:hypothetical protein [Chitinivorax sp. B]